MEWWSKLIYIYILYSYCVEKLKICYLSFIDLPGEIDEINETESDNNNNIN